MRLIVAAAIVFGICPTSAAAQTDNHFAVGVSVRQREAPDDQAAGGTDFGFAWRFGSTQEGWGWDAGLNWFETTLDGRIARQSTSLGDLHVRPLMAGYGYTKSIRGVGVTADVIGGFAFNSFKLSQSATDAYYELGARRVGASVSPTLAFKPEVTAWLDVTNRVGIGLNFGYLFARPTVTITSSLGEQRHRYRADMVAFQIAAVYKLF